MSLRKVLKAIEPTLMMSSGRTPSGLADFPFFKNWSQEVACREKSPYLRGESFVQLGVEQDLCRKSIFGLSQ
ncbi:hypothetical protein TNCT_106141 [Trichonephila clavata]|uniref:Uncharacterized protein n=1 Tax=Trichonephila clavata TaxID=2740835 RepID=A0A8X6KZP2_TRICU|nr:hypothetical protein TNCT_106141 [Trichonephila clavata]